MHIAAVEAVLLRLLPAVQALRARGVRSIDVGCLQVNLMFHPTEPKVLAVLDWELSADDIQRLSSLPTQCRMVHGGVFLSPAGPYRTLGELWDTDE